MRITFEARLGNARIPIQVDIGFGDVITPGADAVTYPTLLDFPAPLLSAYPRETVVAEKFQALVDLGMTNSRMKDFHDLMVLCRQFAFQGPLLCRAVRATFERRRTTLPGETPLALTAEFCGDEGKRKQWQAFLQKNKLDVSGTDLEQVTGVLREFLMPPVLAGAAGQAFEMSWPPAGPWRQPVPPGPPLAGSIILPLGTYSLGMTADKSGITFTATPPSGGGPPAILADVVTWL